MFCDVGKEAASCAPGFFQLLAFDLDPLAPSTVKPHACCPGYFCPAMLTCMLPCPYGAICPRAHAADPPASYIEADPDIPKPLAGNTDKWCAPYGYKMRSQLGCGGADKWTVQPTGAFPMHWYWEGGSGTETPTDNYIGFVLDGCLFLLLALMWHVSKVYNALVRRLSSRERVRVMWHKMAPQVTVIEVAEEQQPQLPPITRSHAASLAEAAAAAAAAAAERGGASVSTGSRFGFIRGLARRSSRACGGAAAAAPVWASLDGSELQSAPLLEYELQGQEMFGSQAVSGMHLTANAILTLHPIPDVTNPAAKQQQQGSRGTPRAAGALLARQSSEGEGLIPVGQYGGEAAAADMRVAGHGGSGEARAGVVGGSRPLLDVGFDNLSMSLKSCGKQVLQGITGAGKTTLMNALAGKASYGVVTGTITINGKPSGLDRHKRLLGFVPQDDIMYRNLTVEENLTYSARFRLPASTTAVQRLEVVASAIAVLGLADVRHALIGDEEVRGISGGQRKRVNVGLELVAEPSLLFLDEPTSGLDSTASKLVVQGLKRVAQTGVTVTAVVHQPSYKTFCLFDDLLLLAKGGLTAYCGTQRDVRGYFEGLGFTIPEHMNPADAYLDIISGSVLTATGQTLDIPASWRSQQALLGLGPGGAAPAAAAAAGGGAGAGRSSSSMQEGEQLPGLEAGSSPAAVTQQLSSLLAGLRSALLLWLAVVAAAARDAVSSARNAAADQLQVGSFLGLMSDRGRGSIASYVGNVVYNIVALGLMAMVSGIKTFGGPERLVYFREAASGLNRLAYFCALDAFGYAGMLMRCAVYLMYVVTAAIYYACTGIAYMMSQVMQPNAAQLAAAVAALINALVASKFSTSGAMGMMNSVSYARWGLEGYVIAEANCLTGVWLLARCADLAVFKYDVTQFWHAMKTLFYIGASSRMMACLGLLLLNLAAANDALVGQTQLLGNRNISDSIWHDQIPFFRKYGPISKLTAYKASEYDDLYHDPGELKGFQFWYGPNQQPPIYKYDDGDANLMGARKPHVPADFELAAGELITKVELQWDIVSMRYVKFTTNTGRTWDWGFADVAGASTAVSEAPVPGAYLAGMRGFEGKPRPVSKKRGIEEQQQRPPPPAAAAQQGCKYLIQIAWVWALPSCQRASAPPRPPRPPPSPHRAAAAGRAAARVEHLPARPGSVALIPPGVEAANIVYMGSRIMSPPADLVVLAGVKGEAPPPGWQVYVPGVTPITPQDNPAEAKPAHRVVEERTAAPTRGGPAMWPNVAPPAEQPAQAQPAPAPAAETARPARNLGFLNLLFGR
ncbi:hypothetical protein COO60DRAFT_1703369 [Scenedesmus sp. NREL 46B-D3]|nr:hypothetical protein COO60DRAFT_1703369 [Scenedesmus sp. NREL 46B-D3]